MIDIELYKLLYKSKETGWLVTQESHRNMNSFSVYIDFNNQRYIETFTYAELMDISLNELTKEIIKQAKTLFSEIKDDKISLSQYIDEEQKEKKNYCEYWRINPDSEEGNKFWNDKKEFMAKRGESKYHHVMSDIQPYQSQIDGSMIESRSKHRAHLKAHKCIEIGNELGFLNKKNEGLKSPPGLKDKLIAQVNEKLRYK